MPSLNIQLKMQQNSKLEEKNKKGSKSLMQRNVTEFRHLLSKCYVTESDLVWTMGLRDNHVPKIIEHKEPSAPEVFFKKTMVSSIREQLKSKQENFTLHANEFEHMLGKKLDKTPEKQTLDQLRFYSDLRSNKSPESARGTKSNKQFDIIPYKQKHQFPKFIKKEFINNMKPLQHNQLQSAFDGSQNQQGYSNKMRIRNCGVFEPMAKAKGRNKVALPSLAWEMGLRDY